ncbi:MAG: tRNA epoxyqueuosine(34) reductase QueG, partial [Pseudomonadota bacterium]|nr:tRNA epoxyqueuosine(34) reductase QueG [Pseudomonadota bacterium]
RIYGCDDCLSVCPWNKFAKQTKEDRFKARPELEAPQLSQLVQLNDEEFRALFRKTAIKRTGHERFIRNTLIAIGNTGDAALAPSAEAQLRARSPLIRAMAVWALKQLLDEDSFRRLQMHHEGTEADPDVKSEWSQ